MRSANMLFVLFITVGVLRTLPVSTEETNHSRRYQLPEVAGYDGWYNNPSHPEWGGADMPLSRQAYPAYADGSYQPSGAGRPNPHDVATACMAGPKGLKSFRNRTALLTFFGQQVVEEILDAQRPGCPPEYHNIPIPKCHVLYDPDCKGDKELPFLRSRYDKSTGQSPNNPRQQLNEITPYIDGGLFYGVSKAWADALRSFVNGTLACSDESCRFPAKNTVGLPMANPPPPADHILKSSSRFYKLGNPRGNENPMLLAMGVIWFRNHNYHADRLRHEWDAQGVSYNDEILFNRARQWNVAEHQQIVLNVWLPRFLGTDISPYTGYKSSVFPGISHAFQTSAMRFGHTLVPPQAYRAFVKDARSENWTCEFRPLGGQRQAAGQSSSVRTCQSYWNSADIVSEDDGDSVDELLFGLSKQVTEREDNIVTEDLRGFVFGPLDFSRRDLMALNIQRGRDHGVSDYNTVRAAYGLPRIRSFDEINNSTDPHIRSAISNLSHLYDKDVNNIDLWPGGLLETTERGPGPLFTAIIQDQFERIRDSDRFWFENKANGLFSDEEIFQIQNVTFHTVMARNIRAPWFRDEFLQEDVFAFNRAVDDPAHRCSSIFETYSDKNLTDTLESCSPMKTFDYFSGSEASYITSLVLIFLYLAINIAVLLLSIRWMRRRHRKTTLSSPSSVSNQLPVDVWMSTRTGEPLVADIVEEGVATSIVVRAAQGGKLVLVGASSGGIERTVDFTGIKVVKIRSHVLRGGGLLCLCLSHRYDLLLRVKGQFAEWQACLSSHLESLSIDVQEERRSEKEIVSELVTKQDRQEMVEFFLRGVFRESHLTRRKGNPRLNLLQRNSKKKREALTTELTRAELATAMGMTETSIFIERIFCFVDKTKSGTVSYQEFLQFIAVFTTGSAESKMELMFSVYDVDGDGKLSREDFVTMLGHLAEQAGESVEQSELDILLDSMLKTCGSSSDSLGLTMDEFKTIFSSYEAVMDDTGMQMKSKKRKSVFIRNRNLTSKVSECSMSKSKSHVFSPQPALPMSDNSSITLSYIDLSSIQQYLTYLFRSWENYRLHIFWTCLYLGVVLCIFAERAYYYSVEREHIGLRRIAGYGVTVTRGAASAMMFTYASQLVTMCRNLITKLRETRLNTVIPFDAAHSAHTLIAMTAAFFTVVHVAGHCINFYHISTQTADDLTCLFREYYHFSHELPKFHYWMFGTLTGLTGFILTLAVITLYVFATPLARRYLFNAFWWSHRLHFLIYAFLILHGSGRLVQAPIFQWFFIVPAFMYACDKLVSLRQRKHEIHVSMAKKLPSGVTHLRLIKPKHFNYLSGQWCRISCSVLNPGEYHPFTMTSAPHENTIDLHIRAVGPWTNNLREVYDPENPNNASDFLNQPTYPHLFLDGPFGEGHQNWYKFQVAILVGGGIGVTPFASILKDLCYKQKYKAKMRCKKVYFFWITKTQKQFEWLTDIIRQVEETDENNLTDIHIFITQFYQKFDLRTIMLYICERHFQKTSNRSLFTGLQSVTHFGRPQFDLLLETVQFTHSDVSRIGTFSCGPPPMTRAVASACRKRNQIEGPLFVHHSENF